MGYIPKTKNGYNLFEMSSMIQKAIRRSDVVHAAYAANELAPGFRKYLWKRLLTVSAEDCFGIMTKEIIALQQADEYVNKKNKPGDTNDLFIAKAIVLLCMARKNRDADYVACNFMWGDRCLTEAEYEEFVDYELISKYQMESGQTLPDYVYDVHTAAGKANGKTQLDMFISENEALEPRQFNLFDYGDYGGFYNHEMSAGKLKPKEVKAFKQFRDGKETDPTHGGTTWTPETYEKYRMK